MITDSLPALPTNEQLTAHAAQIADGISKHLTFIEREPISVYGRCLVKAVAPTSGQTLRFVAALRKYAPYVYAAGRLSTDLVILRQFQDEIARRVALGV